MITRESLFSIIRSEKTPYIQVLDLHGNKLFSIEDNSNVEDSVIDLEEKLTHFEGHGRLVVKASEKKTTNFQGAYKYTVFFEKTKNAVAGADLAPWAGGWKIPPGYMPAPPAGYVPESTIAAQVALFGEQLKHMGERFAWEKEKMKNDIGQYKEIAHEMAPYLMMVMGKTDEQIEKVLKFQAMGRNIQGPPSAPVAPTLDLGDLNKLTPEQISAKIEQLMNALQPKISGGEMIILLSAIDKDTELAYLLGKAAEKIDLADLKKILTGLITKPELAKLAVQYIK